MRKGQENTGVDMLGALLEAREDPQAPKEVKNLDNDTLADQVSSIWFTAFDAPAVTLNWILKFLAENTSIFRRIQVRCALFLAFPIVPFPGRPEIVFHHDFSLVMLTYSN